MTTTGIERKLRQLRQRPLRPGDPTLRPTGRLLIVGGGEDKHDGKVILQELVARADGGRIVVATLASGHPAEVWADYERALRAAGARHVAHLDIRERADAESPAALRVLEGATAVYFTGGDQLRITSALGDTPTFSRIYEIFVAGGTIAGTSAGAAIMSETMIVGGEGDASARVGSTLHLAPGLGFAKDMVIDMHFAERGRIGRLIGVVAQNPRILGIGIDEDTAVELEANRRFRVLGRGGVYVLDGAGVTHTNVALEEEARAVSVYGVRLHVLTQGDEFDLTTRAPRARPAETIDAELAAHRHAGNGARRGAARGKAGANGAHATSGKSRTRATNGKRASNGKRGGGR